MKRKEAIKQTQEGVIQVFNDYYPSTKKIKKFLKEAFPEDDYLQRNPTAESYKRDYLKRYEEDHKKWTNSSEPYKNLPIINLSTITKRKKTKLSQLEKLISDVAKDVAELRQTLAKDVEVVVEEVESELVVGEWYIRKENEKCVIRYTATSTYGFGALGTYGFGWALGYFNIKDFKKATPQEVETALANEAKKQGFINEVTFIPLDGDSEVTRNGNSFGFIEDTSQLLYCNYLIFKDGIWAEIKETIKEEVIDWNVPQLVISVGSDDSLIIATIRDEDSELFVGVVVKGNSFHEAEIISHWDKEEFKPFKGKLTIE